MTFNRTSIVIAIDDAGSAARALDFGLELAEALHLPTRIVHVLRPLDGHAASVRRIGLQDIHEAAGEIPEYRLAADLLDRALSRAAGRALEVEAVLLGGDPADALLRYLGECDRPMLIMGRRGQGPIREALLGGVSAALIRHAECPVTVVS